MMAMSRHFPPPWTIDEQTESFIVRDAKGQALPTSILKISHSAEDAYKHDINLFHDNINLM
jgi:hypothetical protein